MKGHLCPWWGGYFIDNRFRRWLHDPERILSPYVRRGMRVLDFGCGMGMFSIALARLVGDQGQVVAIDLQQRMLDVLLKRAARADVAGLIRARRCEIDSMGFKGAVDFALAFYSVHEVPDQRRLLSEIWGCLCPAGQLLVVEPIRHVPAAAFEAMVSIAGECGFEEEKRPRVCLSRAVVLRKVQV